MQAGRALDLYREPKEILTARTFSDLNEVPASIEKGNAKTVLGRVTAKMLSSAFARAACACLDALLLGVRESDAPAIGSEIGISIDAGAVLVFEPESGKVRAPLDRRTAPSRLASAPALLP